MGRGALFAEGRSRSSFAARRFAGSRAGPPMGLEEAATTTLWSAPSLIGLGAASLALLVAALVRGDSLGGVLVSALVGAGVYLAVTVVANHLLYGGQRPLRIFAD